MLYVDYMQYKLRYFESQKIVNDILDEKTLIFQKTQPQSSFSDTERVDGGKKVNKTEQYVITMEQRHINERLEEAKAIMRERKALMIQKESELRDSMDIFDIVYILKWFDGLNAKQISKRINYSEAQVYRMLKVIRKNLNMIKNERI